MPNTKKYPVVLFLYKRPDSTKQLLNLVAGSGTKKVYIFADGPKKPTDKSVTDKVAKIVNNFAKDNISIKFILNFSPTNKGLKYNIVNGLNSVFAKEQAAIILEDDCIPSPSFFRFTNEMLSKYQSNSRVMSITGSGVGNHSPYSYDFSKYQLCWGWATWARSWNYYDGNLSKLNSNTWKVSSKKLWHHNSVMYLYWKLMLFMTKNKQINTWSFQWSFSIMYNLGLTIIPTTNLISNIGFDKQATNTITKSPLSKLKSFEIKFPLSNPPKVQENIELSKYVEKYYYNNPIAILGMLRQLFYYLIKKYAHRS